MVQLAAQPQAAAATSTQFQSYYTVQVLAEMIDAGGVRDSGIQITLADAKSLRLGQVQRHPLTVFMKDGIAQMTLPKAPNGVNVPVQGMLGPNSANNVTENCSWVFTLMVVANTAAKKVKAADHGVNLLCTLLEQGLMNVKMTIPATATHGEIEVESKLAGERVQVTRQFGKMGGGKLAVKELVNVHIACAKNVPPLAKKRLEKFAGKYTKIITTSACEPMTTIKETLQTMPHLGETNGSSGKSAGKKGNTRGAKVSKTSKVGKKVRKTNLKKPACR